MPRFETIPGSVTRHRQPRPLSYRRGALILAWVAGVLWLLTFAAVLLDVALRGRLPDPVPNTIGMLATTASVAALALWLAHLFGRAIYWRVYADVMADLGGVGAEQGSAPPL